MRYRIAQVRRRRRLSLRDRRLTVRRNLCLFGLGQWELRGVDTSHLIVAFLELEDLWAYRATLRIAPVCGRWQPLPAYRPPLREGICEPHEYAETILDVSSDDDAVAGDTYAFRQAMV